MNLTPSQQQRLDAVFERFRGITGPGVAVGVARHGTTRYRAAFGMASIEHRVPMTPAMRLPLDSTTKHMTCAAVLLLVHEGRLSLDDTVGRWFPELAPPLQRPTLRQLMNHTGGMPCHFDPFAFNGLVPMPVGEPFGMLKRHTHLNFEPGAHMAYCNGGYVLLSLAVERASGLPFERFMRERLFAPLRMDATEAPRHTWPWPLDTAQRYIPAPGGGWRHGLVMEEETLGNGSAVSTVDDMLRWAAHLRTSSGPLALETLAAPTPMPGGGSSPYGLGLVNGSWRGLRTVEHGGGSVGSSSHLLMLPDEGVDVIVMLNSSDDPRALALAAAAEVLDLPEAAAAPPAVPFAGHEALAGRYLDDELGFVLGLGEVLGQLGVGMYGGPLAPALQAHVPSEGELPGIVPSAVGPRRLRAAGPDVIELHEAGRWRPLRRIDESRVPGADVLMQRLGHAEFVSAEAGARLRFELRDGELLMRSLGLHGTWDFWPRALNDDLLVFSFYKGMGSWLARLRRDGGGLVRALEMSSTRTMGLVFERRDAL